MARRSVPRPETRRKILKALEAAKRCRTWAELEKASGLSRKTLDRHGLRPGGWRHDPAGATAPTPEVDLTRSQHPEDIRRAERLGSMCDCSTDEELRSEYFAGHMSDCPAAGGPVGGWSPPVPLGTSPPNVAYHAPRDSQRQRVYDAEAVWQREYWTNFPPEFESVAEAEQYMFDVLALPEVQRRFGGAAQHIADKMRVTKLGRNATATGGAAIPQYCEIQIAEDLLLEPVALHELAHLLSTAESGKADHGSEFTNAHLNLVEAAIGPDAACDLAERYERRGVKSATADCGGCLARTPPGAPDTHEETWRRPPLCDSCLPSEGPNTSGTADDELRWASTRSGLAEHRRSRWEKFAGWDIEDERAGLAEDARAEMAMESEEAEAAVRAGSARLKAEHERLEAETQAALTAAVRLAQTEDIFCHVMSELSPDECSAELAAIADNADYPPTMRDKARQLHTLHNDEIRLRKERDEMERTIKRVELVEAGKPSLVGDRVAGRKMADGFVFTRDEQRAINLAGGRR